MIPLADRLRPKRLEDIVGQGHLLSQDKLLYKVIKSGKLFSMIFWGPPGVGKTTLARVVAKEANLEVMEFSAITTGVAELKRLFESVKGQLQPPLVFIDEIHRFNKAQQDLLLPYVENGTIILVGATTENPSFEVIGPLLSRTRVIVLKPLSELDLKEIIKRAKRELKIKIDKKAEEFLIEVSGGDARILLNTLEVAAGLVSPTVISNPDQNRDERSQDNHEISLLRQAQDRNDNSVTTEIIEEAFQKKALMYDKAGDEHYNTISAFIKSMRASQVDAALYYLARMVNAGEDPLFIARRMVVFASEDIGMAQPTALVVANEVFRACETIGYPECQENLAHGVVYMALAKKDRSAYDAYFKALEDVQKYGNLLIPLKVRNAPTSLMKELGYGKGYEKYTEESYLPEKLKHKKYYK